MKKSIIFALLAVMLVAAGCSRYESVKGDPLNARIYTLDNGLKVYMTVNKDEPRIQTYMPVRVGGKNDPADNTGLAHYLEHMLFKGTEQVGTQNYEAEKPLLAAIDSLFEVYRTLTDQGERLALYHVIDSISYEASKIAIPNEYDKLMSVIGSEGTNAYTSNDVTCYVEDIPSNQIENWAKIESDRFKNCVFRGFHTELEAVYEEKNMGLTDDDEKAMDAIDSMLFAGHPYGTQTVIGTQDHLKNPSLRTIRTHKDTYYVPNNVAICLSGDFDPDKMIKVIKKYFGDWKPNPDIPVLPKTGGEPLTRIKSKDVYGFDAEFLAMAWKTPGAWTKDSEPVNIVNSVLMNGMAGLIDLDLIQSQKLLGAFSYPYIRTDHGMLLVQAMPKEGQSLKELEALINAEIEKLSKGDFPDELVQSAINNYKLRQMQMLVSNRSRASMFVNSFVNGTTWEDEVGRLARIEALTKEDIVAWASNYAVVYKHIGTDTSIKKIDAPKITPIETNRDKQSAFLAGISATEPKPIEPVFVDFSKDLTVSEYKGQQLLYKKNEKNDIASVSFRYDTGTDVNPILSLAADYIDYLGTETMSAEQIASRMYNLACSWNLNVGSNSTVISVSGLSENIPEALCIVEDLLANAKADPEILDELKADLLRERKDAKLNQRSCNSALQRYVIYGPEYIKRTTLPNAEIAALDPDKALSAVKGLANKCHKILYYGPESLETVTEMLGNHYVAENPEPLAKVYPPKCLTPEKQVFVAHYDSRQFNYLQYSDRGEKLDLAEEAPVTLFNEYYGGGMNAIVFQEMRESRALAYGAGAWLSSPDHKDDTYYFRAYIASQNDKLRQAVEAFDEIIEDMPKVPENFDIAKTSLTASLRTRRTIGNSVLYSYLESEELGLDEPREKYVWDNLDGLTMDDLVATHEKWVKGRTYAYSILGDTKDLDMDFLRTLGPVKIVTLEEIFGY